MPQQEICSYLHEIARKHPGEIVQTCMGGEPTHIIQSYKAARHVTTDAAAKYAKHMVSTRQVIGWSRMTENGERWRVLSRLSQPALSNFDADKVRLATFKHMTSLATRVAQLSTGSSGTPIPVVNLNTVTASVLAETLMNRPLDAFGEDCVSDVLGFMEMIEALTSFDERPVPEISRGQKRQLLDLRSRWIRRMDKLKKSVTPDDKLLHRLLTGGRAEIRESLFEYEVLLLFGAGTDSTAATLTWASYMLAKHPQVQVSLRNHVEQYWRPDGSVDLPAVADDPALLAFLAELWRLYPPVPLIARVCEEDDDVYGYRVRAGERVLISNVGLGRDPTVFQDPEHFDPDRNSGGSCPMAKTMPFSEGLRACGGRKLAMLELPIALSVMLRHLDFQLSEEAREPLPLRWQLTMHHDGQMPVLAKALQQA